LIATGVTPRLAWLDKDTPHCAGDPITRATASAGVYSALSPEALMTETAIEYGISAYGRDRLPTLLDGVRRYISWDALIPAVFGVSTAEFEAGWQAYLFKEEGAPRRLPMKDDE
jgi:hypothetical protein